MDEHLAREYGIETVPWLERTITPRVLVGILATVLIASEILAIGVAYETEGDLFSGFVALLVLTNLLWAPLAFWRPALGVLLLVPWLLVVPRQVVAGQQLWRAHNEAARIATWAYETQRETGAFPPDLGGYRWHDPGIRDGIFYYRVVDDEFGIGYGTPGTESSAHTASSSAGWFYYPD